MSLCVPNLKKFYLFFFFYHIITVKQSIVMMIIVCEGFLKFKMHPMNIVGTLPTLNR